MKTQNARLLQYLKTHKRGITQLDAFNKLGICRLSERIRELNGSTYEREHNCFGYVAITRDRERVKSRYGVATVTRYRLA